MDRAKPYAIPKREVWEAYKRVRANQGAAGIDGQTIADFEADLTNNLYKLWNRLASGSYFPPPVRRVLAAAGYISRTPRRGSIVQPLPFSVPLSASFDKLLDTVGLENWHSETLIVEFDHVVPPKDLRKVLKADPNEKFQKVVTIFSRQDKKIAHLTTWVPKDIAKHYSEKEVLNTPRLELLRRGGVDVAKAVQTIGACPMPRPIASLLETTPASPAVRMTRVVKDKSNRVVEFCEAYSPWQRYEYRIVIE